MIPDHFNEPGTATAVVHHVLLVEDDDETAQTLKRFLESQKQRVTVARNGGQAMSSFIMRKPDCVILDLILPGESGFELCERMKQKDDSVPVLVLSAIDMDDSRGLAGRVGADGYLTKPCRPDILLSTINEVAQSVWERTHSDQSRGKKRVRFSCECGKRFKVSRVHRGRTLTCPDCGETIVIPHHD